MYTCSAKQNMRVLCDRMYEYRQQMVHSFIIAEEKYTKPQQDAVGMQYHHHVWFRMKCALMVTPGDINHVFGVKGGRLEAVRDSAKSLRYVTKEGKFAVYARCNDDREALIDRIKKLNSNQFLWAHMDLTPDYYVPTLITGGQDSRDLMYGNERTRIPASKAVLQSRKQGKTLDMFYKQMYKH